MEDRVVSQTGMLQDDLAAPRGSSASDRPLIARSFPELLVKLREERNLSKAELAKRSSLDPSSITRFEQGTRAPERSSILQIADAMVLPARDRDRLLASAGLRSELWDDPAMVDLVNLLNDTSIPRQAKAEVRSVLKMATAFLRTQRMSSNE